MTKILHTFVGNCLSRRILMSAAVVVLALGASAQTSLTSFTHSTGRFRSATSTNKIGSYTQQDVHEDWNVIYAKSGNINLYRRTDAFHGYVRWFNYSTDGTLTNLTTRNDGFGSAESANYNGNYGLIKVSNSGGVTGFTARYNYGGSGVVYVGCDQSSYYDYTAARAFVEPTLSQRIVYEIRPASEMATEVDKYVSTTGKWMEEYDLIAPTGRDLYIGPKYAMYAADNMYANYYYGASNPTLMDSGWKCNSTSLSTSNLSSGQFYKVSSNNTGDVTYTFTCTIGGKTYNIARYTVHYKAASAVGPANISDTTYLTGAEILANEDFNFGVTSIGTAMKRYPYPLSSDQATFGFFDKNEQRHGGSSTQYDACPSYNEYCFVNDGSGWQTSGGGKNANFANHVGAGTGTNADKGYALYADGSMRPGMVFALKFTAELCPGATMYFSAYVGEVGGKTRPILDFIVVGVDASGNETTLTTFTTGEFSDCTGGWRRILFPLVFDSQVDYTYYRLRVVNKAKDNSGNDFFLDDIKVYLQPAPFEPIQATSPDDCLTEDSPLTMYARLDFGQVLQNASNGTTTFYYRWIAKDITHGEAYTDADVVTTKYQGMNGAVGTHGEIVVPNNFKTLPSGYSEAGSFAEFDGVNNQTLTPEMAFVKESGLTPVGTDKNTNRYVAYIATPMTKTGGKWSDYYTCVVSRDLSTLGEGNTCSDMNGTPVAFGVEINSSLGGAVSGVQKQVCANYSYDLTYQVKYAILSGKGTQVVTSAYVAHWLWGNEATVTANPDLYGATYTRICDAMLAYKKGTANATQKALITRLVQKGLLTLGKVVTNADGTVNEAASDVTYVVSPIEGATSLSYTAFPIAALRSDAPNCDLPQTITLNFPTDDDGPVYDRNVIRFVKTHGENVPQFVSSRPRRVRVPFKRNGVRVSEQNVKVDLSDPTHKYNVVGLTLYATDDADFTQYLKKAALVTATGNPATITGSTSSVDFANLDALKEGKSYTFKMEYKLTDANSAEVLAGACRDDESGEIHNGEAFIQFIVVPELLYLDAEAGLTASWNDDYNWLFKQDGEVISNIAPLKETNVILADGDHILLNRAASTVQEPANATGSNLADPNALPYITYDINYEPYTANNVYVPVGTALPGQSNVDAKGKWTFDMPVTPAKWILTAMPIQGVVSGDMFIPAAGESETDVFAVRAINHTGTAIDRTGNPFYNSLYNSQAIQKDVVAAYDVDITSSTWTFATNSLNTKFGAGYGWALGYNGTATDKTIRFPKVDTEYHFFNTYEAEGVWNSMTQTVDRTNVGKPAFQVDADGNMVVTLKNNTESEFFLLGNPTFAYIDLAALKAANDGISAFYTTGLLSGRYALVSATQADDKWKASISEFSGMLKPMQAVFVKATSGTSLDVVVKASMLRTSDKKHEGANGAVVAGAPRRAAAATRDQVIYIEASALDFTATAAVFENEDASNDAAEEDVELFMLDKSKTPFSIFTIAGEKALAINMIDDATIVPLAMYSEKEVESEELTFTGDDSYLGEWDLVDQQSDLREALYDGMSITLMMPTTGSRYYLEHSRHFVPGTATGVDNSDLSIKAYTEMGQLTVFSDNDMADFRLYDAAGRLIMAEQNAGRVITANLIAGAYMVRANGEVLKVIVK